MREIKFRAWDEDDKMMRSWEEVILSKEHGDDFYLEGYKENEVITSFDHEQILEQYTGMKDRNGIEIYDGDEVHDVVHEDILRVYFSEKGEWRIKTVKSSQSGIKHNSSLYCRLQVLEIIGNIHEEQNS